MPITATELIEAVGSRVFLQNNQKTIQDTDIISYANLEMRSKVFPVILQQHEDYYIATETINLVSGVTKYRIPDRSFTQTLRDVAYVDTAGNIDELPFTQLSNEDRYPLNGSGRPSAYYLIGNSIQLLPLNITSPVGSLKVRFAFRPNTLVTMDRVGTITAISGNDVTLDTVPSNITVGSKIDLITAKHGNEVVDWDVSVSAIAGSVVTLSSAPDSMIAAGDYMATATETPVLQIPEVGEAFLVERVALRCFQAMGRQDREQSCLLVLRDMERELTTSVTNRATEPQKLIRKNSFLRRFRRPAFGNVVYPVRD